MRWGFLGIGRVTPRMVQAVRRSGQHELVAVAGRDAEKLQAWSLEQKVARTHTDFQQMIDCRDIDAIYVALPPSLHQQWTEIALRSGKVVLCEKPLAMDYLQADQMRSTAIECGVGLYHATALTHHPRSVRMKQIVQSGSLGKIARITIACTFSHVMSRGPDYRTDALLGGGCLLDLGWYCAFTAMWMTGQKAVSIQASGQRLVPNDPGSIWISAQAIVTLDGGAIAHWDCGFDAAGRKWIEIAGNEGSIICDDFLRPWDATKPRFWIHGHDGKAQSETVGEGVFQEANMIDSITSENQSWRQDLDLAIETQRVMDAWQKNMMH